jgi:hypothetical protein
MASWETLSSQIRRLLRTTWDLQLQDSASTSTYRQQRFSATNTILIEH